MSPITSITYHIHTPTLAQVQAVIPFDIDPADPRTAAWYLLGAVYGRDDEKIWNRSGGSNIWAFLDIRDPIVAIALALYDSDFYASECGPDLIRMLMRLDVDNTTAVFTAMLLYQHIDDGTWGPTIEARRVQEEARVTSLPTAPGEFDDISERAETEL